MGISIKFLWTTIRFSVDMSFFVLRGLIIVANWFQDKNWGVLEVNRSECHRKIDNLSEKRTKPTLDQ